jgi:hypothetical protein
MYREWDLIKTTMIGYELVEFLFGLRETRLRFALAPSARRTLIVRYPRRVRLGRLYVFAAACVDGKERDEDGRAPHMTSGIILKHHSAHCESFVAGNHP